MKKLILISLIIKAVTFSSDGLNYKEPQSVKRFFKEPVVRVQTPSIQEGRKEFTTQREMLDYLGAIHTTNSNTTVDLLGPTSGGKYLPIFILSKDRSFKTEKPTVMLIAQQHGNEPMGCDVLLATIKRVAKGDLEYLLDRINVVVLPRVNPDGAQKFTRVSGERKDINDDHMALTTIEAQLVSETYTKFNPDVFIDIHEYISDLKSYSNILDGDAVPYYDLLILNPTNQNYSKILKNYTSNNLSNMKEKLNRSGYTANYYYNPFLKPKKDRPLTLYQATSSLNLARNMYGLKGSLSYLIELRGREIGFENVKRRLESGSLGVEVILKDAYDNHFQIKNMVKSEREKQGNILGKSPNIVKENSSIKIINVDKASIEETYCELIKEK